MKVIVQDADVAKMEYNLEQMGKDVISFGRSKECDIILRSPFVSRSHGVIYKENGIWNIQDMQSTSGIYFENRKVEQTQIKSGTVILLAANGSDPNKNVKMRFVENAETAVKPSQSSGKEVKESSLNGFIISLISLIAAGLGLVSVFLISKTGPLLPLLLAALAVAMGIMVLVKKNEGKAKGIVGVSIGGVVLILSLIVLIHNKSLAPFHWAEEGKNLPLYETMSKIFDPKED